MAPELIRLYQEELHHLREGGQEFAREHPKIAARLGLEGMEVADPYVERLLEGFAFLTARVRLKLDAEQPRLIAQLLESMAPNFLAPVPSMMVARFGVDVRDPNLLQGYKVPRGSALLSSLPRGQDTACEFRTAHAVTLWPLELAQVRYFSHAPDLHLGRWPQAQGARGGLRLTLRCGGGLRFNQLPLDRLALYINAPDDVAWRLHELLLGATLGTLVLPPANSASGAAVLARPAAQWRGAASVQPLGFESEEALLPESLRAFSGHRLLQELAALPQRFLFVELTELAARLAQVSSETAEVVLLFKRAEPGLEPLVEASSLALHCTPAINLFPKRLDRVVLESSQWEYQVLPDRTRPMDFEVHHLHAVHGHGASSDGPVEFKPLYSWQHDTGTAATASANSSNGASYYTLRREPRRPSARQQSQGARVPSYLGEEVFLALADAGHGPYRDSLRQLSVQAWVTNRDLPLLLPPGHAQGEPSWRLDTPGPVNAVHSLRGPTRPVSRRPVGELGWQLVAQLTRNHLALGDDAQANAAAVRQWLHLYGPPLDAVWQHQVEGLRALHATPVVRRLPFAGPLSFGSGVALRLEVDEQAFQGASAFLLASVLDVFFARHAALNSFSQLQLESAQRGRVMQWPARVGGQALW